MGKSIQQQARALGDPTRYEIFRFVADSTEPTDVSAVTEHFGLNHNAIRQHLAKLVDAGLLDEFTATATGRGRPRLLYRVDPNADGRWGLIGPYERLSLLLAEVVRTGDSPEEVGRRAGRAQFREAGGDGDPLDTLVLEMERSGFDPQIDTSVDSVSVTLQTCPFATAAAADPDTVCSLHMGMVEGIADGVAGFVIDQLERAEPLSARCCVHGHIEPPGAETAPGTPPDAGGSAPAGAAATQATNFKGGAQ